MTEPMDMPDGPGWWAFRGDRVIVGRHPTEVVKNITEWEPDAEHPYYRFSDERWPSQLRKAWFLEEWAGQWYRVYMPWEQQPAPSVSVPSGVLYALLDYAETTAAPNGVMQAAKAVRTWLDK